MESDALKTTHADVSQASLPLARTCTPIPILATPKLSLLQRLPAEITHEILRHLLSIVYNKIVVHKEPVPPEKMNQHFKAPAEPLNMDTYLQRGSSTDDITCLTSTSKCILHPKVLGTCRRLYERGLQILYQRSRQPIVTLPITINYGLGNRGFLPIDSTDVAYTRVEVV